MSEKEFPGSPYELGDKVRIRAGQYQGRRGLLCSVEDKLLAIKLDEGEVISLNADLVTNYSLAARRAWQAMPKRSGRPKAMISRKKMVSLRIETALWDKLGIAVEQGLVTSREQAINDWLRTNLDYLFGTTDTKGG